MDRESSEKKNKKQGGKIMKKLGILGVILPILTAFPQVSDAAVYTLDEYTGDDSQIILTVTGEGTHQVTISAQALVPGYAPPTGDIRAIYFDWAGDLTFNTPLIKNGIPNGTTDPVSGADVTAWNLSGNIDEVGHPDTNMNGNPPGVSNSYFFDGGVQIGGPGANPGDYFPTTSFTLSANENIYFENFGVRLKSIPPSDGSSKLYGEGGLGGLAACRTYKVNKLS
jgi:hypothetical protein